MIETAHENSECEMAFVIPYTFFTLLKTHLKNNDRIPENAKITENMISLKKSNFSYQELH